MADQKNGKGFSGFDDLVSDISKDLEDAKATTDSYPTENQPHNQSSSHNTSDTQTSATAQETYKATSPSEPLLDAMFGPRFYKWTVGYFIVVVALSFLGLLNHETEKKNDNSYVTRPKGVTSPAPAPSSKGVPGKPAPAPPRVVTSYSPAPALPRMDLTGNEIMPQIGTNNVLSRDEIRYCLSEKIRVSAMKEAIDRYSDTEINLFNTTVQRYNSRCAQFRYRKGSLESVRSEVEAARGQLELEGMSRVYNVR